MTIYNVHLYREMRLLFEGIEASSIEVAAAKAREFLTEDAVEIADCDGETFTALVDVAGDETFEQTRLIDFDDERLRKPVPDLLESLKDLLGDLPSIQEGVCQHCGRDYREEDLLTGDCPSDDCPSFKARAALAAERAI